MGTHEIVVGDVMVRSSNGYWAHFSSSYNITQNELVINTKTIKREFSRLRGIASSKNQVNWLDFFFFFDFSKDIFKTFKKTTKIMITVFKMF